MPTYEYQCQSCKKNYDLHESFSAPSEHVCHECGQGTAKRVLHAPKVVFKGSGWYINDSRGSSSSTVESDSKDSSSDSGSDDTGSKVESAAS